MGWLIKKLFPFAMILFGAIFAFTGAKAAFGGGEKEPTPIAAGDLSNDSDTTWYTLTGGGIYLNDWAEYTETRDDGSNETVKASYASFMTEADARKRFAYHFEGGDYAPPRPFVLVKFTPAAFNQNFPDLSVFESDQRPKFDDLFKPLELSGTRVRATGFSNELKAYARKTDGWNVPIDSIVIIEEGEEALQQGPAIVLVVLGLGLAFGGGLWVKKRLSAKRQARAAHAEGRPAATA